MNSRFSVADLSREVVWSGSSGWERRFERMDFWSGWSRREGLIVSAVDEVSSGVGFSSSGIDEERDLRTWSHVRFSSSSLIETG